VSRDEEVLYDLEQTAKPLFDALAGASGISVIDLLAAPLEERLFSRLGTQRERAELGEENLGLDDHSTSWFPHLQSESPHRIGEMKGFLAFHLRRVLDGLIERGTPVPEVIDALRNRRTLLFRRIELDVLASHPSAAPELLRDILLDPRYQQEYELRVEYAALLSAGFPELGPEDQEAVLDLIEVGPDFSWEEDEGRRQTWREQHVRDWLALLEGHLDVARSDLLNRLKDMHGPARTLDRHEPGVTVWSGPSSPVASNEIAEMSVDDLLGFIREWTADGFPMGPSPEGFARALDSAIAADPVRFALQSADFIGMDATYVRALLNGLENALREERGFEWKGVLELGQWLVVQPVEPNDGAERGSFDSDADFRPARKALMSLLQREFTRGEKSTIPFQERQTVWELIGQVSEDENPSPEYEDRWGGSNMDPATLALNTVRPYAVRTAIKYALWVNRQTNGAKEPLGMQAVPEVRELLERVLDPGKDQSRAVRASIGYELGHLVWFDGEWIRGNREQLFPEGEDALPLRRALFDTFLKFGWKTPDVVETIPEEYGAAIERAASDCETRHLGAEPDEALADHLMTLYWQGFLPLEGDEGLVGQFFSTVPDTLRKRAIHFIGWALFGTEDPVDQECVDRLRDLWDWRSERLFEQTEGPDSEAVRKELFEFGWWFASRAFDLDWAFTHLQRILRLEGAVEWDHEVASYLRDLAQDRPRDVVDTLALFDPTGGGEIWKIRHWLEHARGILQQCLKDDDPGVRQSAVDLVNRWVAGGHLDLRELLATGQS
jgi:hypothetical protein